MNIKLLLLVAFNLNVNSFVLAKEISVEFEGSRFTMTTDRIDKDPSITDKQKKDAILYLENICKHGQVSPFLWEKKISSPQGGGYKTEIFWKIDTTKGPGHFETKIEMPNHFVIYDSALKYSEATVAFEMFADGDHPEVRLVLDTGRGYFVYGRSLCNIEPGSILDVSKEKVGTVKEASWKHLLANGITVDTLPAKILPEMKEEIRKILQPNTRIVISYSAKNEKIFTK